jgi:hypothetical protein
VRLKTGQDHQGWVLLSVKGREATLEKNKRSATLTLPAPTTLSLEGAPPTPTMLPRPPTVTVPRRGGAAAPHQVPLGAPKQGIPGDPRPLEEQL